MDPSQAKVSKTGSTKLNAANRTRLLAFTPESSRQQTATRRSGDNRATEWLIDNYAASADYDYPLKKRRYVTMYTQQLFTSLVTLYTSWFGNHWNHFNRVAELYGLNANNLGPLQVARAYISHWILDLYSGISQSLYKIDKAAHAQYYNHDRSYSIIKYDTFLVDLHSSIRPTHITNTPADEMLIPLICQNADWTSANPLRIDDFNLINNQFFGFNSTMVEKKLCKFSNLTDNATGTPCWLFDVFNVENDKTGYAWFSFDGNYDSNDVTLAYIIGCACSPKIGPVDRDEWHWFPYSAQTNFDFRNQEVPAPVRNFRGRYEILEYEVQYRVAVPDVYRLYPGGVPNIETSPLYIPPRRTATSYTHQQIEEEDSEVPTSPAAAPTETAMVTDALEFHRFRRLYRVYHEQVFRDVNDYDRREAHLLYIANE